MKIKRIFFIWQDLFEFMCYLCLAKVDGFPNVFGNEGLNSGAGDDAGLEEQSSLLFAKRRTKSLHIGRSGFEC